jgi:hypothetical protein
MKTVTVDAERRVRIPEARPGQVFEAERDKFGNIVLAPVALELPGTAGSGQLVRENGRLVWTGPLPMDEQEAITKARGEDLL